ncbi:MAG: type I-B CRISPR-associated endonuclease Cas1b [Candidatus Caldatribacteriota bacterium]|jgi:CRISPR-associated protein Cas1
MKHDYYIFKSGRLKRKDNTVFLETIDGERKYLPIESIDSLHLFGEIDLNTKLLNYLTSYGIIINFYNYYGYYSGSYYPRKQRVSGYLLVNQVQHYLDKEERLFLAKQFIISGVFHMVRNLRRYENTKEYIEAINRELSDIDEVSGIPALMGIEGRIRNVYYSAFNNILKYGFLLNKREKRPPNDPVNALISFGNSLLYSTVLGEIYKTQLDPTVSYLHEPSTRRFSLSLDLSEIFKPLVIDSLIFYTVNNKILNLEDFDSKEEICLLNEEGKKKFIKEYEKKLSTTIKHRKLKRSVSYRSFIKLECYKLIKHLIDDELYKPLKAWW